MIPLLARVGVRLGKSQRQIGLWLPLFLVWLLLLPLVLILLPVFIIACWIGELSPLEALGVIWSILSGLRGLELEIDAPSVPVCSVLIW